MTDQEWSGIIAVLTANWPHHLPPQSALAKWRRDVDHLPAEQVLTAVEALYRDGREFPPNGAQILAKVSELGRDDPDHGEAWRLVYDALAKHVPNWQAFYAALPPAVAEAARRFGFESQAGFLKSEEATVRAQFRNIYKAVCEERRRDDGYAGLPSAGLRGLERGPRQLGEALKRALPEQTQTEEVTR